MQIKNVYMGSLVVPWMSKKNIKYITFSVTDDCNLMCKYCYFTHKTTKHKMTFDVAKKAIDYILSEPHFLIHDGVVWDFIGGEPTLEMDLIDQICDYILYKMYIMDHKWLCCYRFMIGTNGLLYSSSKFQSFLLKHNHNLHVNITVDGSKEKHNLSRVKKDGSGSYDDIVKILPLWFMQTGNYSTKATFAHDDLPYLEDSIINLWNLGFKNVMANVVFENVWKENDDVIYEQQLRLLADYIIEKRLWNQVSVRFFSPSIGFPLEDQQKLLNFCGSGNMLAIDYRGDFFPCVRFMNSALNNKSGRVIGNSDSAIMYDRLRAFNMLSYDVQSPEKCIDCDISSGCNWCTGFNYDESSDDSIFERQIYHCKMHHANVRANRYFWKRYEQETGNVSPLRLNTYTAKSSNNKYLYIYNNTYINTCCVASEDVGVETMSDEILKASIDYCEKNNIIPIYVGFKDKVGFGYYIGDQQSSYEKDEMCIDFVTHESLNSDNDKWKLSGTVIYSINYDEIGYIYFDVAKLARFNNIQKINVVIKDYYKWGVHHLREYKDVLNLLSDLVVELWSQGIYVQINVVTDNLFLSNKNFCSAGSNQWAVAPDGRVYACIGEYLSGYSSKISVFDAPSINDLKYKHKDLIVCERCNVKSCNKCYVINNRLTCELDAPFEIHCVKSNLELQASIKTSDRIAALHIDLPFDINKRICAPICLDPLVDLRGEDSYVNQGFYKVKEFDLL